MSQKIQVRRGSNATRQTIVFDAGEPVFTTDTKKVYIGDGSTAGGVPMSTSSDGEFYVELRPVSGATAQENGTLLRNALIDSRSKNPFGMRSPANPYTIFLYSAVYKTTGASTTMCIPKNTAIIGVGNNAVWDCSAHTDGIGVLTSGGVKLENLWVNMGSTNIGFVPGYADINSPVSGLILKNITYSGAGSSFFYASSNSPVIDVTIDNVNPYNSTDSPLINSATSDLKNVIIKNENYFGSEFLDNGAANNYQNMTIENSRFKFLELGLNTLGATGISSSIIRNCFFESGSFFSSANSNNSRGNIVENSTFLNSRNINSWNFRNCHFRKTSPQVISPAYYAVSLSATTSGFPSFFDCSFISSVGQPMITGTVGTSGLFVNCIFNTLPFTGSTGLFGAQGSRYDSRYV